MNWLGLLPLVISTMSYSIPPLKSGARNSSISNSTEKLAEPNDVVILFPASKSFSEPTIKSFCPEVTPANAQYTRFDEHARKCGIIGSQEHCHANMRFYSYLEDNIFGHCDCLYNDFGKPFVYDLKRGKCFQLYERGTCKTGQWLTMTKNGQVCTRNKCLNVFMGTQRANSSFLVLYKDQCVELSKPNGLCKPSEIISFESGDVQPKCMELIRTKALASFGTLRCSPGTFLSLSGKCRAGFKWD